ncbi:hypothetical protein [Ramlibacter sp.]|uniref:hypothetical protein n=1 Tax=Ramlibacter sp. TaxID=1917967 RepID=UPI002C65BC60|nr:hypothetical protein [Ramlibacter sp.]HWI83554.1 hypothetical protein [Ramlibacter sp.]
MTAFAHVQHPTQHPGVIRMERAGRNLRQVFHDATRSSATLLLTAMVAALLVVANQVIDTWSEGHLLAAWIAMWAVAFAGMALLAAPAKRAAVALGAGLKRWNATRRQAAEDRALWQLAQTDSRVMADLTCAMGRGDRAYF